MYLAHLQQNPTYELTGEDKGLQPQHLNLTLFFRAVLWLAQCSAQVTRAVPTHANQTQGPAVMLPPRVPNVPKPTGLTGEAAAGSSHHPATSLSTAAQREGRMRVFPTKASSAALPAAAPSWGFPLVPGLWGQWGQGATAPRGAAAARCHCRTEAAGSTTAALLSSFQGSSEAGEGKFF